MPNLGPEVKFESDILDFKSDILLFFWSILATETFFDKKNRISQKKKMSRHISFDFLGQNPNMLSGKRLPQTAKYGVQKKGSFFE